MDYPRHERESERAAWLAFIHALRHPSELGLFFRSSIADTRDYYAARDVVDLEREELIQIIAWTRKMALNMTGSALFLVVITALGLVQHYHVMRSYASDDFNSSCS